MIGYHEKEVNDVIQIFKLVNREISDNVVIGAWSAYSDDNYCAGWISMEGYSPDEIIKIITEYGQLDKITINVANIQERLEKAIHADLHSDLCKDCEGLVPYDASPESCKNCAIARVTAVIKAAFPEIDLK